MTEYLIKPGCKKIEGCQDSTIGTQTILFHHILVIHLDTQAFLGLLVLQSENLMLSMLKLVYRIPYIDVGTIRDLSHSRIQIYYVPRRLCSM